MRYIGYGLLIILLTSGCVRRVRHIPVETEPVTHQNNTESNTAKTHAGTGRLYDTTRTEHKYKLKPEPYSVGSKEKDPELLGSQGTIREADRPQEIDTPTEADKPQEANKPIVTAISQPTVTSPVPSTALASTMNRQECVSMIGAAKFERYSKRFGGEDGAIKRCAILKKLKRG